MTEGPRRMPNILLCSSLFLSCCLYAMIPMVHGLLGKAKPLSVLVPVLVLHPTFSSSSHGSADLSLRSGKIPPSSIPSRWLHLRLPRSDSRSSELSCCLSPELHEFGWGFARQGTGTVPDSEPQALEGAVLGTACGSAPAWRPAACSCSFLHISRRTPWPGWLGVGLKLWMLFGAV